MDIENFKEITDFHNKKVLDFDTDYHSIEKKHVQSVDAADTLMTENNEKCEGEIGNVFIDFGKDIFQTVMHKLNMLRPKEETLSNVKTVSEQREQRFK